MDHQAFRILGLDTSFTKPDGAPIPKRKAKPYYGSTTSAPPKASNVAIGTSSEPSVTMRLADLLPLLIEATEMNRAWVQDFSDDKVSVSQDLYEVILAYGTMRRAA
ncbi:MAG: hypothetical protein SGI77_12480 [Pirellulaceae bacterium]|nr:hypothetical protein [Pirellulaceae bacterium]